MKKIIYLNILLLTLPFLSFAQQESNEKEEKRNEVAIGMGGTTNKEATAFTIGIDYQYRITKLIGVGAIIDHAMADINSTLIAPALFLHAANFEFAIAPALEFIEEGTVVILRLGVAYGFELSRFSISPGVFWDSERNGESAIVYGLKFGYKF